MTTSQPSGSTLPDIVEITDPNTPAQAARAAGVLAGFAVGLRRGGELRSALEYLGLTGIPPLREDRKALTADLDMQVQRRRRRKGKAA